MAGTRRKSNYVGSTKVDTSKTAKASKRMGLSENTQWFENHYGPTLQQDLNKALNKQSGGRIMRKTTKK